MYLEFSKKEMDAYSSLIEWAGCRTYRQIYPNWKPQVPTKNTYPNSSLIYFISPKNFKMGYIYLSAKTGKIHAKIPEYKSVRKMSGILNYINKIKHS